MSASKYITSGHPASDHKLSRKSVNALLQAKSLIVNLLNIINFHAPADLEKFVKHYK